jgi:hypothetical protein
MRAHAIAHARPTFRSTATLNNALDRLSGRVVIAVVAGSYSVRSAKRACASHRVAQLTSRYRGVPARRRRAAGIPIGEAVGPTHNALEPRRDEAASATDGTSAGIRSFDGSPDCRMYTRMGRPRVSQVHRASVYGDAEQRLPSADRVGALTLRAMARNIMKLVARRQDAGFIGRPIEC